MFFLFRHRSLHRRAADDVRKLKPGDEHYRAYVGDPANYDLISATTFNLLTTLGLREQHRLLDVGCGSLRNGRLLIPYLNPGNYTGIEPNRWLVREGIRQETGKDIIRIKKTRFSYAADSAELDVGHNFNVILAQSIFSHCGKDLISHWLDELTPRLNDEGMIVATYMMSEYDSGEQGWLYPGLIQYREETFRELLEPYGLNYTRLDWPHPIQAWFMLTASKQKIEWIESNGLSFQKAFELMRKPK